MEERAQKEAGDEGALGLREGSHSGTKERKEGAAVDRGGASEMEHEKQREKEKTAAGERRDGKREKGSESKGGGSEPRIRGRGSEAGGSEGVGGSEVGEPREREAVRPKEKGWRQRQKQRRMRLMSEREGGCPRTGGGSRESHEQRHERHER